MIETRKGDTKAGCVIRLSGRGAMQSSCVFVGRNGQRLHYRKGWAGGMVCQEMHFFFFKALRERGTQGSLLANRIGSSAISRMQIKSIPGNVCAALRRTTEESRSRFVITIQIAPKVAKTEFIEFLVLQQSSKSKLKPEREGHKHNNFLQHNCPVQVSHTLDCVHLCECRYSLIHCGCLLVSCHPIRNRCKRGSRRV